MNKQIDPLAVLDASIKHWEREKDWKDGENCGHSSEPLCVAFSTLPHDCGGCPLHSYQGVRCATKGTPWSEYQRMSMKGHKITASLMAESMVNRLYLARARYLKNLEEAHD